MFLMLNDDTSFLDTRKTADFDAFNKLLKEITFLDFLAKLCLWLLFIYVCNLNYPVSTFV